MSLSANFGSLSISSNLALSKSIVKGHSDPWKLHMERFSSVTWPWSTWGRRGSCSSCQPTAGRGPEPARPEFVEISSGSWVILTLCFCGSFELLRAKLNLWHHNNLLVIPVALLRDQRRRTSWWHRSRPVRKNLHLIHFNTFTFCTGSIPSKKFRVFSN